ncbi:protein kinase [Streptomyces sp. VRA16 Mangrove soil]|uniref:protein kinase domain-containing protein n=1 Tax=Streptomyces sp. VRA16 Mangrove soil TaxID=2817434 RepID=UPI001A9FB7A4|nr:protein kinase [Streptomyces sp. VRA16 Mangrove soil]MBO1333533.1 protein kinase [Streptomyces sp. VRA16 Mangrove soil]
MTEASAGGPHGGQYAGRALANNRYQLRDLLGQGGMASVHLAHDTRLDRAVAIKTLHTELGREDSFRQRFVREAQAVAKLTHTNIVSVFDSGEDDLDGAITPYIVMEYVEGRPLGSVLDEDVRRFGAMPSDKALKITADVLAALEISHEMGLVHRDIKPGNVMMTKRGVVKVMDFGIARAMQSGVTSMTQTGMVVGTPQYLSPEQALGRGVDARSDLYSVGIMLFQLVTGRLPFEADSPLAIAYAHVQEEPVAPSSINRALPPAIDALVARALKKNPNERFPSADAMREECLRVAASLTPAAPSIVPGTPTSSGQGVGSAVFPPVGQAGTPTPGPVQTPYQPGPATPSPYGTPTPQPGYSTPPPTQPQPSYGYPQQGQMQGQGQGYQTPPPYTISPQPTTSSLSAGNQNKGNKKNTAVIVGSIVVALVAIGGLVTALMLNGDDKGGGTTDKPSKSTVAGHKGPDLTKTIETTECSEPQTSYNDENKIQVPDFYLKNIKSVKACLRAAGWKYKETSVDENTFGEGSVMNQVPAAGEDADPKNLTITLSVSTGDPAGGGS